jgi:hypothetical protein
MMKIEVAYLLNGLEVVEVIDRICFSKEQAGSAAIDYAKAKGSRHFPYFKVLEEENAG